jgi:hypothetical protein
MAEVHKKVPSSAKLQSQLFDQIDQIDGFSWL